MQSFIQWRRGVEVLLRQNRICTYCTKSNMTPSADITTDTVTVRGKTYNRDSWTNVTPTILQKLGKNLHGKKYHPLNLIKLRINDFFYKNYFNKYRNPLFSVYDNLSPVVTLYQNYDSLLVPVDHPSRRKTDSYYINSEYMLRAHTSCHQVDLIGMGLDAFLLYGDVYRRDAIDSSHFPVFHQVEGLRLYTKYELFNKSTDKDTLNLFEDGQRLPTKQESHTHETSVMMEHDLKKTLENLTFHLFGKDIEVKWVDAYFPFTHPSWELEIKFRGEWMEVLGCGIMEQKITRSAGAADKVGWAFGLGLERLAMKLYEIPDIRWFWSEDTGFLSQFEVQDPYTSITFKPVSDSPPCINDISFWINQKSFSENDFYDLVRAVGGNQVEQVHLIDSFFHPKKQRQSQTYRIVYRHMERPLTQNEVNILHEKISSKAVQTLDVDIR
ncbi:phenylalanine--tRNA ligase, mitochondrial-like [Mizuhopecten yessoensis]|uniref:Phenylalanine--tRNA ligase, mitochondrial n=1 Tax=Mizuhopecten yessoensis TaxID=6573 RepID=A0A210QXX3_MIZYE|nr:phenylalanine--tRNA ligase, mitochondrial-like [Mizuhopecten yessoensis]OWF53551.1 Phenylalanine--tRNA ligase, mitochondrial [Mizuhopecten yessoensis]